MTENHQQEKRKDLYIIDNVVKEDEGYFTASSSSDSEPEKEVSNEATLTDIGFPINPQRVAHLTQEQTDSPTSVYMEAMNEPQETDQKEEEERVGLKELKLGEKKEQEVSSPVRRRRFGLSLISELDSGLSSLNYELDSIVDDRLPSRTFQRSYSNLEKLQKEMDDEIAKSIADVNANNLKLNVNYSNTQKGNSKEEEEKDDKAHEIGNESTSLEKKIEESSSDQSSNVQSDSQFLKEQMESQDKEIDRLREDREALQAKVSTLEKILTEKNDENAILRKRQLRTERESSARVSDLSAKISQLTSDKQRSQERITRLEDQNSELISKLSEQNSELICKLSDQREIQKQQEETIIKLREETSLINKRFLQVADRKIEEVAEEFKKNFEDKLRILSQRIRVAEQLHVENKENWKRTKDYCEQEHPELEKKLEYVMKTSKADLLRLSECVDETMKGMELVVTNFKTTETSFMERISQVSDKIQVSKNWVKLVMEEEESRSCSSIDDKEREKVERLEAKLKKERADKMRLIRRMYELQNKLSEFEKAIVEKDEGLVRLSEEKIEAIKQLCMWIDYHKCRFEHLKDVVLVKCQSKGRKK